MKHLRIFLLLTVTSLLLNMASCQSDVLPPPEDLKVPIVAEGVGNNTKEINDASSAIRRHATSSKIIANELSEKITDEGLKKRTDDLIEHSVKIIQNTDSIDEAIVELNRLHYTILTIHQYLDQVEKQNGDLKAANKDLAKKLKDANKSMQVLVIESEKKMMNILIVVAVVCLVALAAGIYLMVSGNSPKIGMGLCAGAITILSLTYFMRQYPVVVAIVGGVLFVGFAASFVYQIWVHKKVIYETTETVEHLKKTPWTKAKEEVIKKQSKHTKKMVQEAKAKGAGIQ